MPKKSTKKSVSKNNPDFIDFLNAKYGTRDSDHDGITDEVERFLGTDPYNSDTDGDGVSDAEEIRQGRNPLGKGDFKDWFVPHEGNNYHPHALHPKRVLFYATSAVAMKILVVLFALGLPLTAWLSPDLLKEQSNKIISLTNGVRTANNLAELKESQILNRAAYAKASDMVLQQYFAHIGPDKKSLASWLKSAGYRYEVAGENLAMGFSTPEEVMSAWKKSQTHYANIIDPDFKEIGVGAVSGPYQGEETVLVAQYFGTPVPAITPVKTQAVKPAEVATPAVQTVAETANSRQQIAPAKITPTIKELSKPVALGLSPKNIIQQANYDLKIFAPGASEVWLDGKTGRLMAEATSKAGEWHLNLKLEPGKNIFYLTAKNDTKELSSDNYEIISDIEAPLLDSTKTKLYLDLPQASKEAIARAEVYLSDDATKAELSFGDYRLDLQPANGVWLGQIVVPDRQVLEPIVPPSVKVIDSAGNAKIYNLAWSNLEPIKSSAADKYTFLRANPGSALAKIFGLSDWFYRLILFGAVMSLCVAVFVEIKKQHPKMIVSTAGLIILLICLLVF